MAYDANITLQSLTTETATKTSAGVSTPGGTPRRGLKARIVVSAISGTSPALAPVIQESADGTTYTSLASPQGADSITATGVYYISFESGAAYHRLLSTISGTSPSVTYKADLGIARP